MRVAFPLYAKILLWFFLNILLLGLICFAFVGVQFRFGLDSLLMGRAGNPIQDLSQIIGGELNRQEKSQWNAVLEQYSTNYQVRFLLFYNTGVQIGGEPTLLPPVVVEHLKGGLPPRRAGFPPGGPGGGPPPGAGPPPGGGFEDREGPPGGPGFGPPGGRNLGPRPELEDAPPGAGRPMFMVHSKNPSRYWVGVRLRHAQGDRMGPIPMTLLAVSDSIRGHGLFIDFLPWVEVGCAVILVSLLFWLPLVRGITRSISQITSATEEIARGRFEARVADGRRDELGRLGLAINQMAGRLSGLVTGQKRFLGDIAHELCSPIARIQLALGILEQRVNDPDKVYLEDLRDEVQQMTNLVNELLSFSKASLEPAAVKLRAVNVSEIVSLAVRRESTPSAQINLEIPQELTVQADPDLLQRSVANLIRNAIRYAGEGGPITIAARAQPEGFVEIVVSDCGPGVPEESLAQLFDPFYRPELARARETGGVGLGLSIVKTCIESCQGSVTCHNRVPKGLAVTINLRSAGI